MISRRSCKQAAILMTRSVDGSLGWLGRLRLEWHLRVCDTCTQLERQLRFLRDAARQVDRRDPDPDGDGSASPEFLDRIKGALRAEDHSSEPG